MPLFGRGRELDIARTTVGLRTGAACVFVGEAGMGKSALAAELAREHRANLVAVSPSERMWPYSGLSAVAAGLGGARGAAIDGILDRGRDWPEHLMAEEVSRTLHLIRDDAGVLVIDDLDEMDGASLTVLSYVFGRLRGTGVTILATVGPPGHRHEVAALPHVRLEPLAFEAASDLAREIVGPASAAAVRHLVVMFTGGDPGVLSRVRLTAAEAAGEDALPLPLRLSDDRSGRPRREAFSPRGARADAVLDLLSIGPVYDYERLRLTALAEGADVDQLIDDGTVRVHDDLARMSDPALRLRRHAAMAPEDRRRLHAQAADDHRDRDRATQLWHESYLEPDGDRGSLLAAAVGFARAGETASAVEFAERALSGRLDPEGRTRGLVDLGGALVLQGLDLLGQHYLRRAGRSDDAAVRVRAAIARLRAGANVDHVIDDVLVRVDAEGWTAGVERLLCESARLHLGRGELAAALEALDAIAAAGAASTETAMLRLLVAELGCGAPAPGRDVPPPLDPAVLAADAPVEIASLSASVRMLREEYAAARRQATELLERVPRVAPLWRERVLRLLVVCEVRGGDASAVREAVAAWRHEWAPGRAEDAATTLLCAEAAAADPLDARAGDMIARGRHLCRREGTTALLPFFAALEGRLALAEGRYEDAVDLLRGAGDAAATHDPSLLRIDADLIEALWLTGREAEARRELARFEAAAARHPRRWTTLAVARSRAVCRSAEDGARAFRDADAVLRSTDAPSEHSALHATRERCLPTADRSPAARTSTIPARGRALSPQEQEVVALVEQGLRNREIASALFVSLRTVELRLTRVYRKLGVTSRVHLVSLLRGAATP